MGDVQRTANEPTSDAEGSMTKENKMNILIKLAALYRLISEASDEEISIMLGYAQNLKDSRPKPGAKAKPTDSEPIPTHFVSL